MGNTPKEVGRFRTLDDGTFLFRKNKTTPTYNLTAEQYGEIKSLQTKEYVAAYLLAPPLLLFAIMTLEGDFGFVWKAAGIYAVAYLLFTFFFSRNIWSKIDRICNASTLASPENTIVISSPANALRIILSATSARILLGIALLFSAYAVAGIIFILSIFISPPYVTNIPLHWSLKLFVGLIGIFVFGVCAYFAIEEIHRRRDVKPQSPEGDKT